MEIKERVMVPLGYGKYARSDKIISLEPIEDDRGPGRRTVVHNNIIKILKLEALLLPVYCNLYLKYAIIGTSDSSFVGILMIHIFFLHVSKY